MRFTKKGTHTQGKPIQNTHTLLKDWEWEILHTIALVLIVVCGIAVVVGIIIEHYFVHVPLLKEMEKALALVGKS